MTVLFNMYSEFFPVSCFGCVRVDAANARDRGCDHNGGSTDGKEGKAYGEAKGENEYNEDSHEKNTGKQTAEKTVFAVCARGDISAEKCCEEERDQ